jgi:hypothetical protein
MPTRRAPLALLALLSSAAAQTASHTKPAPAKLNPNAEALPITRVALYKNGVGFFEHTGRVAGDQSVTIDFTSAQLNDVLQSLTAIDLNGGRISGAAYNSTTPLDQQLKSLPLSLSDDPSDVDFYNAIRGARVQVTAPGATISGRLLSIDLRAANKKDDDAPASEKRFLTVVSDSGQVRTLELTQNVSVTLLDTALHTDVTRYLELLASTRNQGLRHLTLLDRGPEGPSGKASRELRVSYISEVPVWKSTYRILFTDSPTKPTETATLQGWSVVDNTTGSDWLNVHLDLIAGAPQSFIQPLSTPYYTRRPEIPLPTEAQLSPQTHDSGEDIVADAVSSNSEDKGDRFSAGGLQQMVKTPARISPGVVGMHGMAPGAASGISGGLGMGNGAGIGGGGFAARLPVAVAPFNYQQAASASITPQTTTSAFDDFFEYSLSDPITIRKNESALVPILQTKLPVERVTLWTPQQPVALRALWITNASDLNLDRGSFSIVENGSFGGEGLLDPIHPGEKRLLSYAADQAVRVTVDHSNNSRKFTAIAIHKGVITETAIEVAEVEYLVHNAAPEPRMVVVEQPSRQGWTLDSDPKPAETTPTAYRFRVATQPRETVRLHIGERHTDHQYIRLVDRTEEQLRILIQGTKASPAVLAALQPLFDLHNQVVDLDTQIHAREADIAEIAKDQDRIRSNMSALKGSAEERSLIQRYTGELNAQEDRLAALRKELADLHIRRDATDRDFQTKLDAVDLDETL